MRPIIPALRPVYAALAEPAYALLRIVAGGFLVPHGMWKLFGITGDQRTDGPVLRRYRAASRRFPLMIAVGLVEFIGGILSPSAS